MKLNRLRMAVPVLLLGAFGLNLGNAELAGVAAPDFVLKSVGGQNLRLSEYRGQVVLLSFWASWCGDCRSQLEGLTDLYGRYEGAGFELLAVSLDREMKQVSETVDAIEPSFPVLHDLGGVVGEQNEVQKMPYVFLIDRDGMVRDEFEGYRRGNEEDYLERVRTLMTE